MPQPGLLTDECPHHQSYRDPYDPMKRWTVAGFERQYPGIVDGWLATPFFRYARSGGKADLYGVELIPSQERIAGCIRRQKSRRQV